MSNRILVKIGLKVIYLGGSKDYDNVLKIGGIYTIITTDGGYFFRLESNNNKFVKYHWFSQEFFDCVTIQRNKIINNILDA